MLLLTKANAKSGKNGYIFFNLSDTENVSLNNYLKYRYQKKAKGDQNEDTDYYITSMRKKRCK